jgi:hypothetical protein
MKSILKLNLKANFFQFSGISKVVPSAKDAL